MHRFLAVFGNFGIYELLMSSSIQLTKTYSVNKRESNVEILLFFPQNSGEHCGHINWIQHENTVFWNIV